MKQVYLALGTNIEPRKEHLVKALQLLSRHDKILLVEKSSIYETAPVGYTNQAEFLNMVAEIQTSLSPLELLDYCQSIEQKLGRKREIRFGPRTIDLDILVYNQENRKTDRLILPHPRMHERAFVLVPLHEISPELRFGEKGKTVADYIEDLSESDIKDVSKWTDIDLAEE
ncbi:2-amino-4-hydroxy-6-hydroxymethyldihydropteridine diphosphokinase [Virgibacillus kekensis]|uniref:2-amino-4-hydroxy-6-hydroxymethyldihydropteridine diphosphokinase n=1 Tax=Virgibacillus kekensis TaxID=202261 RepID=A0ABV9DJR3_9BACI